MNDNSFCAGLGCYIQKAHRHDVATNQSYGTKEFEESAKIIYDLREEVRLLKLRISDLELETRRWESACLDVHDRLMSVKCGNAHGEYDYCQRCDD